MRSLRISCALLLLWAAAQAPGGIAQEPEAGPGLELLEFLGEWETDDGELIDPLTLDADPDRGAQGAGSSGRSVERGRPDASPLPGRPGSPRSGQRDEDGVDATISD